MTNAAEDIINIPLQIQADNIKSGLPRKPLVTLIPTKVEKIEKENFSKPEYKEQEILQLSQQGYIKYPKYDFF